MSDIENPDLVSPTDIEQATLVKYLWRNVRLWGPTVQRRVCYDSTLVVSSVLSTSSNELINPENCPQNLVHFIKDQPGRLEYCTGIPGCSAATTPVSTDQDRHHHTGSRADDDHNSDHHMCFSAKRSTIDGSFCTTTPITTTIYDTYFQFDWDIDEDDDDPGDDSEDRRKAGDCETPLRDCPQKQIRAACRMVIPKYYTQVIRQ
ncbi:hypothetical protein C8J56DRAFT_1039663 [Mycena floridula]|nr:hypothetical protein C8J56DRAFT_1039663 [Mycena floridula]